MKFDKEMRVNDARESLAMAQKILSRFEIGEVLASEMPRVLDAASQAMQAAQLLHQVAGILQAEISNSLEK